MSAPRASLVPLVARVMVEVAQDTAATSTTRSAAARALGYWVKDQMASERQNRSTTAKWAICDHQERAGECEWGCEVPPNAYTPTPEREELVAEIVECLMKLAKDVSVPPATRTTCIKAIAYFSHDFFVDERGLALFGKLIDETPIDYDDDDDDLEDGE